MAVTVSSSYGPRTAQLSSQGPNLSRRRATLGLAVLHDFRLRSVIRLGAVSIRKSGIPTPPNVTITNIRPSFFVDKPELLSIIATETREIQWFSSAENIMLRDDANIVHI